MDTKHKKWQKISAILLLANLTACQALDLATVVPAFSGNSSSFSSAISSSLVRISRQRVHVSFLNQLPNGERVPLTPELLSSLSFNGQFSMDASAFPANKGLEQDFPFIEAGEHTLSLSFKSQLEPVKVPLVIPEGQPALKVLVIMAFDLNSSQVQSVEVGYDQNDDQRLDNDQNIYRSRNGLDYQLYQPDGLVRDWVFPEFRRNLSANTADAPLPPGTEPDKTISEKAPVPQDNAEKTPPPPVDVPTIPAPRPIPLPLPAP